MRSWLVTAAVLGACYQPTYTPGIPCTSSGDCPGDQRCDPSLQLCGVTGDLDASGDALRDGRLDDATPDAAPYVPFATPILLTGVNSISEDTDPAISADGLELIFTSNRAGGAGGYDLYRAIRISTADAFGSVTRVTELATASSESAPEFSGDALTLYFRRSGDIYRATRPGRLMPFGAAVLDNELSSAAVDTNPAISASGLYAVITHEAANTDRELFLFTRATTTSPWGVPRQLTELSTTASESGAAISPDGLTMFIHSDRPLNNDISDIYVTTRPSASSMFGPLMRVDEVSTVAGVESDPTLTPNFRTLVFERDDELYLTTR